MPNLSYYYKTNVLKISSMPFQIGLKWYHTLISEKEIWQNTKRNWYSENILTTIWLINKSWNCNVFRTFSAQDFYWLEILSQILFFQDNYCKFQDHSELGTGKLWHLCASFLQQDLGHQFLWFPNFYNIKSWSRTIALPFSPFLVT